MRIRLILRDIFAGILATVPIGWFERMRLAHGRAPSGSLVRKLTGTALGLVRYRRLDDAISVFSPADRPDIQLVNADSIIVRRVYWLGTFGWEDMESAWWERFCARANGILEIGANIGLYTVLGAKAAPTTPYVAVEPHPISVQTLRRNIEANGIDNVRVIEAAVVGKKSVDTMELMIPAGDPDAAPAGAILSEAREGGAIDTRGNVTVKLVEAAALIAGVDLIKIDVEGYEYDILSSVTDFITRQRPTIFIEVLRDTQRLRDMIRRWQETLDYRLYVTVGNNLLELPAAALTDSDLYEEYGTRDVILTTRDDLPR